MEYSLQLFCVCTYACACQHSAAGWRRALARVRAARSRRQAAAPSEAFARLAGRVLLQAGFDGWVRVRADARRAQVRPGGVFASLCEIRRHFRDV